MTVTTTNIEATSRVAARLTVTGHVQGIGLRPAVARFAQQLSLGGFIGNTLGGVELHVEGRPEDVARFEREWCSHLPVAAHIASLGRYDVAPSGCDSFVVGQVGGLIGPAEGKPDGIGGSPSGPILTARVPPDVVVCNSCLAEVNAASDRRHDYPLTSCTDCGPRYSIIERMPFERAQTSMATFSLCDSCRAEYEAPADRRFHAQTSACSECGPQVWLRASNDRIMASGRDAIPSAAAAILDGRIVAIRGLGGYQLLVDATSQEAVLRLRERKRRCGRPLAVMAASVDEVLRFARLDDVERRLLCGPAGPIVIAEARRESPLATSVNDGFGTIGVMLPTTPLHALLLDAVKRPLICTSGNVEGEPLVFAAEDAMETLRGVADVWLEHDRPILRPIDDSVTLVMAGRPVGIRLARGYAPLALDLISDEPLIALGGHQKTSIALSNGAQSVLGPHIGNLDTTAACERFIDQIDALSALYDIGTHQVVCDLHPNYFTTQSSENQGHHTVQVQHHHAHIAAGMLEHGWLDQQVLGVAFDGAGFGTDGKIWGGEFLICTSTGFERVGHLRPSPLPGGERAVRAPWRIATAMVNEASGNAAAARLAFQTADSSTLLPVLQRPSLSPMTTSAGRLFDGVAALVLGIEQCQFEGQAAMLLEAACDPTELGEYRLPISNGTPKQIDWRPLVRQVLCDRANGISPGTMAMKFHRGLASTIHGFCRGYSALPVVLGGGVFQNRTLVELLAERFANHGQPLGLPGLIPPNDGGLAAGQLAVAAALARQRRVRSCV